MASESMYIIQFPPATRELSQAGVISKSTIFVTPNNNWHVKNLTAHPPSEGKYGLNHEAKLFVFCFPYLLMPVWGEWSSERWVRTTVLVLGTLGSLSL